jgi:hypothetical protein
MESMTDDMPLLLMCAIGLGIMVAAILLCRERCWSSHDD